MGSTYTDEAWPVRYRLSTEGSNEMKKNIYAANFSTGTKTRLTEHEYITAAAWIHLNTGRILNCTFSAKPAPSAPRQGIFKIVTGRARSFYNKKDLAKALEFNERQEQLYRHEVVSVKEYDEYGHEPDDYGHGLVDGLEGEEA